MISFTFHWAWLLIAVIIIVAIILAIKFGIMDSNDKYGVKTGFGCLIVIVGLLIAAVIGGIFIW